jgi:hypothetical protein
MGGGFDSSSGALGGGLGAGAFQGGGSSYDAIIKDLQERNKEEGQMRKGLWDAYVKEKTSVQEQAPPIFGPPGTPVPFTGNVLEAPVNVGIGLFNAIKQGLQGEESRVNPLSALSLGSRIPAAAMAPALGAGLMAYPSELGHGMTTPGFIGDLVKGLDPSLGLTDAQWEHESWSPYGTDWGGYLGAPVTNEQRGNRATIEPVGAWNPIGQNPNQDLQEALGPGFSFASFNTSVDPYGQFTADPDTPYLDPSIVSPRQRELLAQQGPVPTPFFGPTPGVIPGSGTPPKNTPIQDFIDRYFWAGDTEDIAQQDLDVFNLDRSMASNVNPPNLMDLNTPWDSVISPISHSDTMREYESRAAAERALYAQIVQQITQAAGQSGGGAPSVGTPAVGAPPVEALNPPDIVSPPSVVSPPVAAPPQEPRNPQPAFALRPRSPREDPVEPRNPIQTLVRTILAPREHLNQLAPHARRALRQGRMPDFSTIPDAQQDLVQAILSGPTKPLMMSDR